MKYMGSKKYMLTNGLGSLLSKEALNASEFIDLFSGSGEVSKFVAQRFSIKVTANDLQSFSGVFTNAIIGRTRKFHSKIVFDRWALLAKKYFYQQAVNNKEVLAYENLVEKKFNKKRVFESRLLSSRMGSCPITCAYGGHYFSPYQALWIDALRSTLPKKQPAKDACLAALIQAASRCAASPGHTAQPFQPTRSSIKWIYVAWKQNILKKTEEALREIGNQYSKIKGTVVASDANEFAKTINKKALVFVDPPYSDVQYSRFYHVLETISRGGVQDIAGVGRYPSVKERPQSKYSTRSKSKEAIEDLLSTLSKRKARVILTFPVNESSNGLSGKQIERISKKYFSTVERKISSGKFSTLGGKDSNRGARLKSSELILKLCP